jgi:MFS family permease
MPLYYQELRGLNTIDTGLLLGPQGIGMAFVMPFVGRLTDRIGGGPLVVFGVLLSALATIPLGLVGAHTSYVWLSAVLVVRGVGIGFAFMPAFVAAFVALARTELPDAAPQLNVMMRVGGSIGVAVLAVVLARAQITEPHTAAGGAAAFGRAFWWSLGLTAVALVPGLALWQAERRARLARAADRGDRGDGALPAELLSEAVA